MKKYSPKTVFRFFFLFFVSRPPLSPFRLFLFFPFSLFLFSSFLSSLSRHSVFFLFLSSSLPLFPLSSFSLSSFSLSSFSPCFRLSLRLSFVDDYSINLMVLFSPLFFFSLLFLPFWPFLFHIVLFLFLFYSCFYSCYFCFLFALVGALFSSPWGAARERLRKILWKREYLWPWIYNFGQLPPPLWNFC